MGALEESIRQHARGLGFDIVRFTTAEPFLRDEEAALERVWEGLMDGLPWYTEERVRRMNRPQELLPGARSVISVAMSYLTDPGERSDDGAGPSGRIARYAWGDDYHRVMKRKLRELADSLRTVRCDLGNAGSSTPGAADDTPVSTRIFVDDGPMNDRAAAERAGLGWFGKNTNILTPSHGSWVFLGQVVTDLELEPDPPLRKTCGSCVRCIDDCPTGAIVAPFVIDNTRCISFLTIELRGAIPRELRPLVGDWVFGCDICQDVCPVNRKAQGSLEPAYRQRHDFAAPALLPLLELDDDGFRERFRNSPIKRAKRTGLQRNVCVALGNIGDPASVPALTRALRGSDALVRKHAAWALGRIGGPDAEAVLRSAEDTEEDPEVAEEVRLALWELTSARVGSRAPADIPR